MNSGHVGFVGAGRPLLLGLVLGYFVSVRRGRLSRISLYVASPFLLFIAASYAMAFHEPAPACTSDCEERLVYLVIAASAQVGIWIGTTTGWLVAAARENRSGE